MITIYGIKNCDTMKKAFKWLEEHHIEYQFHNYKTAGLTAKQLQTLINLLGWQRLLNTKSATWRKLNETLRHTINNEQVAKQIMLENLSIIKRPLLVNEQKAMNQVKALAGFSTELYQQFFKDALLEN